MSIDLPAPRLLSSEARARGRIAHLAYRPLTAPVRFFAAHDVFISYCRRDGAPYAEALANHLAGLPRPFKCYIDQWDGNPETRIPAKTLRAARWSRALVVVATREALESPAVEEEIRAFGKMGIPRPIQIVVAPGIPVQTARWHAPVAGVQPAVENGGAQALALGTPSVAVLRRIESSLTFWRHNRRIGWGASLGAAWLVVIAILTILAERRATRMTRLSDAMTLAMRAEDRLTNDPSQTADALRLGVQSLTRTPTAWGESAVRRGLMLLPAFQGSVAVERQGRAAIGPGGVLAQWNRDEGRSTATGTNVDRLVVIDPARGTLIRAPVELPGYVRVVQFTGDFAGLVVGVSDETYAPVRAVYWIPRDGGAPRRFAVNAAGAFALDPSDGSLVVADSTVERWKLEPTPVKTAEWKLPGVSALALSPDGARLFALRSGRLVSLDARAPGAPVATLARVEPTADATLLATEGHVAVVADSIRTWSLAGARWDHAFEAGAGQAAVAGDRLAVWTQHGATIGDLAEDGFDHDATTVRVGCEVGRGGPAPLLDIAISADGRRAALACGDGTASVVSAASGALLARAPAADATPRTVRLDERGTRLWVYATSPALAGPRARLASWTMVNGSQRVGGARAPREALALALDAGGSSLAAVFATEPMAYGLAVHDPLTGRELARADTTLRGGPFRLAFRASHVALADERGLSLWRVDGGRLRLEGSFGLENVLALQFGGPDAAHLAVSFVSAGGVKVTVLDRGPGGWRQRPPIPASSWAMPGMPGPMVFAPAAVSRSGWVASLAETGDPPGSSVRVTTSAGTPLILPHEDAVTLLRFLDSGALLTATRTGEISSWSFEGRQPERRRIGHHGSPVMDLIAADNDRVLAIDRGSVIRMWALGTTPDDVGLRGFMEFPVSRFGNVSYDALGTKALGVSGERLVTISQHAQGLFADAWVVPRQERLQAAVAGRLAGSLPRRGP